MQGLDCAGIAEMINALEGHTKLGDFAFPTVTRLDPVAPAFEDFITKMEESFECLGKSTRCAREVGDFVVNDPKGDGTGAHISTLVQLSPRVFLTGLHGRGIRPVEERAIRNVRGVHRVRKTT